jgi:hypothetical protein
MSVKINFKTISTSQKLINAERQRFKWKVGISKHEGRTEKSAFTLFETDQDAGQLKRIAQIGGNTN